MHVNEKEILEAALLGYQSQVSDLRKKILEIEVRLNPAIETLPIEFRKRRRKFSAESRAKMAAAQRKRWRLVKRAA